jgi:PilZ domain
VVVDREKRKGERVCTALPVALGGTTGVTRDVSTSGVFFEIDVLCAVGSLVRFTVEVATPARKMILNCEGDVVRTEPRDTGTGLAVRVTNWVMRFA